MSCRWTGDPQRQGVIVNIPSCLHRRGEGAFSFVAELSVVGFIAQLIRIFFNHDWGTQVGISMHGSV